MRFFAVYITLFFATCCSTTNTLLPTSSISNIEKSCLDTLKLEKREHKTQVQYLVKIKNRSPLTIITETINDSVPLDVLTSTEKEKLINAFTRLKAAETKKLTTVKPKTSCGLYFDNRYSDNTLEISSNYSFYAPDGFMKTNEIDRENTILKKYIDSSTVMHKEPDGYLDVSQLFKIKDEKNQYFFKEYETYFDDGNSWIMYKILNNLNYDDNGWLKSATCHRSFYKYYFSEEKKFADNNYNKERDIIWHYTHIETHLENNNTFLKSIMVYYITLDNMDLSEQVGFTLQKECLTFKKNT